MALIDFYEDEVEFIIADFSISETGRFLEMEEFQFSYIPMFYFIDSEGIIISGEAGVFSFEQMQELILPILQ
ncbi:MAG: hypothetical protein SCJ94_07580 [Bacillota bacterium]|nr:hypothetical protein [Bacillota bacterium]